MNRITSSITERFLKSLSLFVDRYGLMQGPWVLAVSGGLDSMVLLDLFFRFRKDHHHHMVVAHFDHGYRNNSRSDTLFVESACVEMRLPFISRREDLGQFFERGSFPAQSVEAVLRDRRRQFLEQVMQKQECRFILTGHHQDDLLETFMMRCVRGTGLLGIESMQPFSPPYARPLLDFSRNELVQYAQQHAVSFREDPTNQDTRFFRNSVRHKWIPYLEENLGHSVRKTLIRTHNNLVSGNRALEELLQPILQKVVYREDRCELDLQSFSCRGEAVQREVLIRMYHRWRGGSHGMTTDKCFQILNRLNARGPFTVTIDKEHEFHRHGDRIVFMKKLHPQNLSVLPIVITEQFPQRLHIPLFGDKRRVLFSCHQVFGAVEPIPDDTSQILLDYDQVVFPLTFRVWTDGDRMDIHGLVGRKRLSRIFQEKKIDRYQRKQIVVLIDGKNDIIWCVGIKRSKWYHLSSQTSKVLSIVLTEKRDFT